MRKGCAMKEIAIEDFYDWLDNNHIKFHQYFNATNSTHFYNKDNMDIATFNHDSQKCMVTEDKELLIEPDWGEIFADASTKQIAIEKIQQAVKGNLEGYVRKIKSYKIINEGIKNKYFHLKVVFAEMQDDGTDKLTEVTFYCEDMSAEGLFYFNLLGMIQEKALTKMLEKSL